MAIQVKHSDNHTVEVVDEVAMTYMSLLIHRLNATLRKNGMSDKRKRQKACEDFLFELSYQVDAGWFKVNERRVYPKVCFLERAGARRKDQLGQVRVVHIPNEASSWHEYALGVVSQYFEEGESVVPEVQTGSYGMEDE